MFCVDLRKKTVIISVYSVNLSVFITEAVFTARYELGLQIGQVQFRP